MKWSEVKVTQLCPILCNPMDDNLPGSSIHGILQARILEWVAVPFSRGSSRPRKRTGVSGVAGGFFTSWATRECLYVLDFHVILSTILFLRCCSAEVPFLQVTRLHGWKRASTQSDSLAWELLLCHLLTSSLDSKPYVSSLNPRFIPCKISIPFLLY